MKKILHKSILIGALLSLALIAGITNAKTAIPQPCPSGGVNCLMGNNTWTPVYSLGDQLKGYISNGSLSDKAGSISVGQSVTTSDANSTGGFLAAQDARFADSFYANGPVVGQSQDMVNNPETSTLSIGSGSATNLSALGTIFAHPGGTTNGGLYSNTLRAPAGTLKPVCAAQDGTIIFCPEPPTCATDPTLCPPPEIKRHYAIATSVNATQHISNDLPSTYDSAIGSSVDTISMDTRKVLIDKIPGFSLTSLAHHTSGGKGILDNSSHIWTVAQSGTYNVKINISGYFSTYVVRRSKHHMEVSFYLRVNGNYVPLMPPKSGGCFPPGYTTYGYVKGSQYILEYPSCPQSFGGFAGGDYGHRRHTETLNYNVAFNQDMNLKAGDQVDLFATTFGYGIDRNNNGDMNFNFAINTLALDVTQK